MHNFNPRSPCGERLYYACVNSIRYKISTHAPRAGSDVCILFWFQWQERISTHAPRAGSDLTNGASVDPFKVFQPTLPVRGATDYNTGGTGGNMISTHAPRAGSDAPHLLPRHRQRISTHAPRAGSDSTLLFFPYPVIAFQPTLPVRGATCSSVIVSPCRFSFQPTLPVRGATQILDTTITVQTISTHAPRAGSDAQISYNSAGVIHFNPRSPCGERHSTGMHVYCAPIISTHAPRAGSDDPAPDVPPGTDPISTHAPRAGSDSVQQQNNTVFRISTHAPRAGSDHTPYCQRQAC